MKTLHLKLGSEWSSPRSPSPSAALPSPPPPWAANRVESFIENSLPQSRYIKGSLIQKDFKGYG
ncbi:hypothetical protein J6590_009868 [Homalodisca vitripennis]|nr:hypothetical protein J6590_009868 [Homalodisca vitripennis]